MLPPIVALDGIKPTKASWNRYLDQFETYLGEWELFNTKVVDYFAARISQVARMRDENGGTFFASRGDIDCRNYCIWIEQDNDVCRQWATAYESRRVHIRDLMAFSERMKQ